MLKFYRKCWPTNSKKLMEAGETWKLFEVEKKREENEEVEICNNFTPYTKRETKHR